MIAVVESETLDDICIRAQNAKIAEHYTWAQILEKTIWKQVLLHLFINGGFAASLIFYGFGFNSVPIKWQTLAWVIVVGHLSGMGITAGAHRLWTHRAYKANLRMRILLMLAYSGMGMYPLFNWIKDHRVHHKCSETNADPHNARRGFFFSHIGWLLMQKHPECIRESRNINLTDILADPVVMFQKKYAGPLMLIFCFAIPTTVPVVFWRETILHAVLTQCIIRYTVFMHVVFTVNSVAHLWGDRKYNRFINPADNLFVSLWSAGEGSHNYHHTFPWDYKSTELPRFTFNLTTRFIDAMTKLGWAYDLREASPELVEKVIERIGHKSKVY